MQEDKSFEAEAAEEDAKGADRKSPEEAETLPLGPAPS